MLSDLNIINIQITNLQLKIITERPEYNTWGIYDPYYRYTINLI